MSDRLEDIKNLLLSRDYITVVQKTGDGCIVTYPYPKLIQGSGFPPRLIECFAIQRGEKPGFWVNTSYDSDTKDRFIEIPEYAMRLYIVCEIAACNGQIPIDPSLMVFIDDKRVVFPDIEDIILAPSGEDEANKESLLYRLIVEARNDGFPPEYYDVAKTHNVGQGYEIIRKFYE